MNPNLEKITKACQKACPELLELSFGCKLSLMVQKDWKAKRPNLEEMEEEECFFISEEGDEFSVYYPSLKFTAKHSNKIKWQFEILGHPIQLQHVLRAIKENPDRTDAEFESIVANQLLDPFRPEMRWNLEKDLNGQSEETLEFIASLLP